MSWLTEERDGTKSRNSPTIPSPARIHGMEVSPTSVPLYSTSAKKPRRLRPQCHICFKTFSKSGALKVHMRIHTGEKPFQCRFCPKAFAQSGNLMAHERIHTGDKPYQCEQCGKRFTQSSAYKNHLYTRQTAFERG